MALCTATSRCRNNSGVIPTHHHQASNILLDHDGHVLLADFSIAAALTPDALEEAHRGATAFAGSVCWMAPEVVEGTG